MAVTVRYAQDQGSTRVLIVDWDLHHDNGTQAIFAHDPGVYCLSTHRGTDLYMSLMGSLRAGTTEVGEAVGHCNIPLLDRTFDEPFMDQIKLLCRFYRAEASLAKVEAPYISCPGYRSVSSPATTSTKMTVAVLPIGRMRIYSC